MDWDDLRFFLAVAQKGSIRAAAQHLKVNHSTVLRRITAFEKKLAVRLFDRLPTGYALTPAGEDMVAATERIEEEVTTLDRQVFGRDAQLSGELRITMPDALASHLLMPVIAGFTQKYSGIEIELAVSGKTFDLTKREADVAIRITNKPPANLIGRRVIRYAKAVYASIDYLAQHDPVEKPEAMNWLGWERTPQPPWWVKESDYSNVPIRHQINREILQLEAAKADMGLTMLPCFIGDREPQLRRLPPGNTLPSHEIWILAHEDLRYTARVRAFIGFVSEALESYRNLLEGKLPQPEI